MRTKIALCALAAVGAAWVVLLAGCSGDVEESPVPTGQVQVMLVDAPSSRIAELHVRFDAVQLSRGSAPVNTLLDRNDLPGQVDVIAAGEAPVILGTVDLPVGTYRWTNLSIDPSSPVNRVVTEDGVSHPLRYTPPRAETANLVGEFEVREGERKTLLFEFAAAASVRETPDGWVLNPRIFSRYVDRDPQFGELSGTVRWADGRPPVVHRGEVMGVFVRITDGGAGPLVGLAEIDPDTGAFRLPMVLAGRYDVTVQAATADWEPVGEPLFEQRRVNVRANVQTTLEIDA